MSGSRALPCSALLVVAIAAMLPFGTVGQDQRPSEQRGGTDGTITPPLSARIANYTIEARLDPATRTITGTEVLVWRNMTTRPVSNLRFHLYWNAWRDTRSTWMREAALAGNRYVRRADEWGRTDVTSVKLLAPAAADLTGAKHFIAPDDGNTDDQTVMAVPLPQPVDPGGSVTVEIQWTAHVPRTFARTGAIGNFFFIAQWFPKIGVLQDAGWNCHQFHAANEFFSDYGVYDVSLTVPRGWTVGATGVQRERRDNGDNVSTTHRYYQEDVHDFVWTTSPDYLDETARFEHPTLPPVDIRLLYQAEHASQTGRHFEAVRNTLKYYGEWFGAYPYGHITVIDPAYQSDVGGMEYPTLFTAGTRWLAPQRVLVPESVTIHEAGHQWWYAMVASNEVENEWMDEGFNTFSTARVEDVAYSPHNPAGRYFGDFIPYAFRDVALSREIARNRMQLYRAGAKSDVTSNPSYTFFPSRATRNALTYAKTALWLNTLERHLGWPSLQKILSAYFARARFTHPLPDDFFDAVNGVLGHHLDWFFDEMYRSSNAFDYGVQDLKSVAESGQFRTSVVVRRYGEGIFPVDVRVTFANGEQVIEQWPGKDRWKVYRYDRASRAVSAEVDPNHVLLLDLNYTNNSKTVAPRGPEAATKWSLKWMVWLQDALLSWAALV